MPGPRKYPQELRERAMRLVAEARQKDPELSLQQAVVRIGSRVGVNPDTLRGRCKQAAIEAGDRPGTTTADAQKIKQLDEVLTDGNADGSGGRRSRLSADRRPSRHTRTDVHRGVARPF